MTLKEFMHTSNPYLDKLASEAETQRIINEEAAYDNRHAETKVDYKVYRVTKKQLDYLTYLLARYGDSSKTPRQLNPSEVSKSIKILKARSIHDPGRGYNATEERKELVKDQYLKKLYALING